LLLLPLLLLLLLLLLLGLGGMNFDAAVHKAWQMHKDRARARALLQFRSLSCCGSALEAQPGFHS